ncbi:lipopolysaccharide biosynthesis protein [Anaeromyxobacter diazotrophicus]|uniref:Translocase n=1 Tax=Anaeromyxobacter diazotrophicus TaxID=2590199 RepID=A0A7I9VGB5_9BACT|nr:oligosaccharide flippase family protein [Anaeromyxobacter diazotrophicus]GEJ55436.1 translocase [Anaeromyxobacter diazotrophicus]
MLSKIFRRVGSVALGTGLGQGLVVLATPYLARRYAPADFGALALLLTVSNISLTVACLRYDIALPSSKSEDVRALLVLSTLVAGALGVVGVVLTLGLAATPALETPAGVLLRHPWLLGACVAIVGCYQATSAWLLRRGAYGAFAAMRVSQGGGFSLLAALPGLGLLWAHVASFAAGLIGAVQVLRRRGAHEARWTEVSQRYREFPLLNLPGAVLDVVGYSICIWVVASHYGRGSAGEYSQVQRLIGAPLMLISISLGQILLKHTAELAHDPAQLHALLARLLRVLVLLSGAALIILWFVGKPVLSLILGPKWNISREMVLLLGVAVFVRACVSPLSTALLTLRRFRLTLAWQAAYFCSAALIMPLVAARAEFRDYLRFYAVHEIAFYGAYLYLIFFAVRAHTCAESLGS